MASGLVLRLRRIVSAPRDAVYGALSDPRQLAKWWGPRGFSAPSVEFAPRVGGGYRIAMQPPNDVLFFLSGEFREVDPPGRLVYTFRWDPPDPDDRETVVKLSLQESGEGTEVQLTQTGFATEERRALHEQGWSDSFARLKQLLGERRTSGGSRHASQPESAGGSKVGAIGSGETAHNPTTNEEVSK